jgi:WD40 repeat protein
MTDVFISYSRKDKPFVQTLHKALSDRNRDTWIDWENIPLGAAWWQEIETGIEAANTFVFVISPDSVVSDVCNQEVAHALKHNKRLLPIVRRDGFEMENVQPALRAHNWLFFREQDDFEQAFQSLMEAIDTDLEHVRTHTRLLVRAIEWDTKQRNDSFLLRGADLEEAERWLTQSSDKNPQPTEQQKTYITKSREVEDANRRLAKAGQQARNMVRIGSIILASTLAIAAVVGTLAGRRLHQANVQLKAAQLEQAGIDALDLFESREIDALLKAMQAGQDLQTLVKNSSTQDYPAYGPILALQQILNGIRQTNQFFQGQPAWINSVSFSPDGKWVATASNEGTADLWDVQGNHLVKVANHQGIVWDVSFSPNGKFIATASEDGTAKLWDLQGKQLAEFKGHQSPVRSISFHPDGELLVTVDASGVIKSWNLRGEEQVNIQAHQGIINDISFSPDGQFIATASEDKTAKLWNLEGNQIAIMPHENGVKGVEFHSNGQSIMTASYDGIARLWDLQGNQKVEFQGHYGAVGDISFSPDGLSIATASTDGTVRLWNLQGNQLGELKSHSDNVIAVDFSPNGHLLASTTANGEIYLWDLQSLQSSELRGHQNWVTGVIFSPDGKSLLTVSLDKTVRMWNISGQHLKTIEEYQSGIWSISFSPDGTSFVTASDDGRAKLRNLQDNQVIDLQANTLWIKNVSFSPDGQHIATTFSDLTARLWDLKGNQLAVLKGHQHDVHQVNFSPDGQQLVTASEDGTARLWNLQGEQIGELVHKSSVEGVSFSPDGQYIATASGDRLIYLWTVDGELVRVFQGHQGGVSDIKFSPDGRFIASASVDRTARIWDLTGHQVALFRGHQAPVLSVSFSPDGKYLATASQDLTARLWQVEDLNQLLQRGCRWLDNYFVNHPSALESLKVCHTPFRFEQAAPALIREGEDMAKAGDTEAAIAKFKQALEWHPSLDLNPRVKATQFRLIGEGEALAKSGDFEGAVAKFQAALELNTGLEFDPVAKARQIAAPALVEQGGQLVTEGKIEEAIAAYAQAQQLEPTVDISASAWANLCLQGSLSGNAAKVMKACDQSVVLDPLPERYRARRGFARALTGDRQGAIADFEAYIGWTKTEAAQALDGIDEARAKRQRWLDGLRAGKNPFTLEELERLRNEGF